MAINIILNGTVEQFEPDNMVQLSSDVFVNPSEPNIVDIQNYISLYGPFEYGTLFWYGPDKNNPSYIWQKDEISVILLWKRLHNGSLKFVNNSVSVLDINSLPSSPSLSVNPINDDTVIENFQNAVVFWTYLNGWQLEWFYEVNTLLRSPLAILLFSDNTGGIYSFDITTHQYNGDLLTNQAKGIVRVYNVDTGLLVYNSGLVSHGNLFSSSYISGTMGSNIDINYDLYLDDEEIDSATFNVQYYVVSQQTFMAQVTFKVSI